MMINKKITLTLQSIVDNQVLTTSTSAEPATSVDQSKPPSLPVSTESNGHPFFNITKQQNSALASATKPTTATITSCTYSDPVNQMLVMTTKPNVQPLNKVLKQQKLIFVSRLPSATNNSNIKLASANQNKAPVSSALSQQLLFNAPHMQKLALASPVTATITGITSSNPVNHVMIARSNVQPFNTAIKQQNSVFPFQELSASMTNNSAAKSASVNQNKLLLSCQQSFFNVLHEEKSALASQVTVANANSTKSGSMKQNQVLVGSGPSEQELYNVQKQLKLPFAAVPTVAATNSSLQRKSNLTSPKGQAKKEIKKESPKSQYQEEYGEYLSNWRNKKPSKNENTNYTTPYFLVFSLIN